MEDLLRPIRELFRFSPDSVVQVVDILLVSYLIYRLLVLVRGTRAWRILGGIIIFIAALFVSDRLQLKTLHWILDKATVLAPVALVILLLPELRQALEGFARLGLWPSRLTSGVSRMPARTIDDLVAAITELGANRVGALIVIERDHQLSEVISSGVRMTAVLSPALLSAIFYKGNPLHDGAAIVRGDTVVAAACQLPLSENESLSKRVHMRHRAGLGVSEQADCVVMIVSEERGTISGAIDGRLHSIDGPEELREFLNTELRHLTKTERPKRAKKGKDHVA